MAGPGGRQGRGLDGPHGRAERGQVADVAEHGWRYLTWHPEAGEEYEGKERPAKKMRERNRLFRSRQPRWRLGDGSDPAPDGATVAPARSAWRLVRNSLLS
jgi:hypothetical protein